MAGPLGKLTAVLGLDAREFQGGLTDAQRTLQGFGVKVNPTFAAIGGAAALGFGLAAKGALQMEDAAGRFQAATGATHDDAVQFAKDMNGLVGTAGSVGKSFDSIYQTGIDVAQQFQTTGKDTQDLTGKFLDFAKATGQDASGAVLGIEDLLSAFGEPAERAGGLLDQLVASSQKFGTDTGPATVDALRGMAPALVAMGGSLDDGVGILNLFETAGLDAGSATRGLTTAVKMLKPGQDLNDLIAQIGSIEDPTLRAKEAMKLFGTRAGTGLANAIKPGMSSLDDFKVSVGDADGAASTAAENMLTTADKIKQFGDKAGAALRGIGADFGPLVSGLGAIGSLAAPFASKLKDLFMGLAASGPVQAAATYVGSTLGTMMLGAERLAFLGVQAVQGLATRIAAMSIPLSASGTTVGTAVGSAISLGIVAGVVLGLPLLLVGIAMAIREAVNTPIQKAGQAAGEAAWNAAMNSGANVVSAKAAADAAADAYVTEFANQADLSSAIASERADNTQAFTDAGTALGNAGGTATTNAWLAQMTTDEIAQKARNAVDAATAATANQIRLNQDPLRQAWLAFTDPASKAMTALQEIAWIKAQLASKALADGLASSDPLRRQWAIDTKNQLDTELGKLTGLLGQDGTNAGNSFTDHLGRAIASTDWHAMGVRVAASWIGGFADKFAAYNWANMINSTIGPYTRGQSPPPKGPLHLIDKWGENIGKAWLGGFSKGMGGGIGGFGLPSLSPAVATTSPGSTTGAGTTVNLGDINVTVQGGANAQATGEAVGKAVRDVVESAFANRSLRWSPGG